MTLLILNVTGFFFCKITNKFSTNQSIYIHLKLEITFVQTITNKIDSFPYLGWIWWYIFDNPLHIFFNLGSMSLTVICFFVYSGINLCPVINCLLTLLRVFELLYSLPEWLSAIVYVYFKTYTTQYLNILLKSTVRFCWHFLSYLHTVTSYNNVALSKYSWYIEMLTLDLTRGRVSQKILIYRII